jgi:hypothetical protein
MKKSNVNIIPKKINSLVFKFLKPGSSNLIFKAKKYGIVKYIVKAKKIILTINFKIFILKNFQ